MATSRELQRNLLIFNTNLASLEEKIIQLGSSKEHQATVEFFKINAAPFKKVLAQSRLVEAKDEPVQSLTQFLAEVRLLREKVNKVMLAEKLSYSLFMQITQLLHLFELPLQRVLSPIATQATCIKQSIAAFLSEKDYAALRLTSKDSRQEFNLLNEYRKKLREKYFVNRSITNQLGTGDFADSDLVFWRLEKIYHSNLVEDILLFKTIRKIIYENQIYAPLFKSVLNPYELMGMDETELKQCLYIAAQFGNVSLIQSVFEQRKSIKVDAEFVEHAITSGNLYLIKYLEKKLDLTGNMRSFFQHAVDCGSVEIVLYFKKHYHCKFNMTLIAAAIFSGNVELVKCVFAEYQWQPEKTLLDYAAVSGSRKMVEYLISINPLLKPDHDTFQPALLSGNAELLAHMIDKYKFKVSLDEFAMTLQSTKVRVAALDVLLKHVNKADFVAERVKGFIKHAVLEDRLEVVKFFSERFSDFYHAEIGDNIRNARSVQMLDYLLQQKKGEIPDDKLQRALEVFAYDDLNVEMVKFIVLNTGVKIDDLSRIRGEESLGWLGSLQPVSQKKTKT